MFKKLSQKMNIEHPRRFMLIIDIVCLLILFAAFFLGAKYIINEIFISKYNDGEYKTGSEKGLTEFNFPEGYVPYYNLGNAYYKQGEYDKAISYYKKALTENPPHSGERECDIRVNLALAMLQKIDWSNMETEKDVERVIRQLKAARNVLTEEGCANPDDPNGHNKEAEQLKKDIDDMIEQLQQNQEDQQNNDDQDDQQQNNDNNQDDQNNDSNSDREDELRDELEDQMTQNQQEHQDGEDQMQQYQEEQNGGGGGGSGYDGKTW